ncbi:protein of unknown function (plasmid) [Caballeronia sp. S22]
MALTRALDATTVTQFTLVPATAGVAIPTPVSNDLHVSTHLNRHPQGTIDRPVHIRTRSP